VVYLPNGIAPQLLARAPEVAARARPAARPTIGFLGYLGPWLDFDLLNEVARQFPEAELVLVGPADADRHDQLTALQRLANVRFAGPVAYDRVAATLATFDVGLIPFQVIPYTRAVNPLKLYEYAAQEVPIVTTAFSPDVEQFGTAVHVAHDPAAFIAAIRAVLSGGQRPSIRWIAEQHTWPRLAARYAALLGVAEAAESDERAPS
jgi:glycosyltransferase involved in cell wall biosynthesis